ncbi:MAG: cytochrome c3 family protein [Rhodospirillaceae bacterium]
MQVFSRPAVLVIKLVLLGAIAIAGTALAIGAWRMSPRNTPYRIVAQPIPFSHKHHAGDDGIDCRYCHTSVEKSRYAGLPTTEICLTCHSQLYQDAPMLAPLLESERAGTPIAWTRVHDLPDFVYFDHSIHVAKGVACIECHGRVDQMPVTWRVASLEMQWCLACHRDPGPHLHRPDDVYAMHARTALTEPEIDELVKRYRIQPVARLTDCSTCHR